MTSRALRSRTPAIPGIYKKNLASKLMAVLSIDEEVMALTPYAVFMPASCAPGRMNVEKFLLAVSEPEGATSPIQSDRSGITVTHA